MKLTLIIYCIWPNISKISLPNVTSTHNYWDILHFCHVKSSKSSVTFTFTAVSFPVSCMSAGHSLPTLSCTRSLLSRRSQFHSLVGLLQILLTTLLSPALSLFHTLFLPHPSQSLSFTSYVQSVFLSESASVPLPMLVPLSRSEKYPPPSEHTLSFVIINSSV